MAKPRDDTPTKTLGMKPQLHSDSGAPPEPEALTTRHSPPPANPEEAKCPEEEESKTSEEERQRQALMNRGLDDQQRILATLTKECVYNHRNSHYLGE